MAHRRNRWLMLGLALLLGGVTLPTGGCRDDSAKTGDAGVKAGAPAQNANRSVADLMRELQQTALEAQPFMSSATILDDARRSEAAPRAIPALKKMNGLVKDLRESTDPLGPGTADQMEPQLISRLALLVVFGDKKTSDDLETLAKSADQKEALRGRMALIMAAWIGSRQDPAAQGKLLADAEKLAAENPTSEPLTRTLLQMGALGPASPELAERAQTIASSMSTPTAEAAKAGVAAQKKLRSMENRPLTIQGTRSDGTRFSTARWKGKVILVDFWSTWCRPCENALPEVIKAYADFHDKGLEVLGVSAAYSAQDLRSFLDRNKDMVWPQLFDAEEPGSHALAKAYGISAVPTRFLIDRKGVLRSITTDEKFAELIPKLLAERR